MGEAREQNEPVSSSSKREQKMLRAESWMVEWFLNWYQWWIVHTTINVNNNYQVRVSIYWLYLWVLTAMLRSISFTTTTNWIDRLSGLYSSEKRRRFSSFVLIRFSKLLQGPRGGMVSCSCDHHIHATRTYPTLRRVGCTRNDRSHRSSGLLSSGDPSTERCVWPTW